MCFTSASCPGKKRSHTKIGFKAGHRGSRIILGSDGAKFSFSSTSKLPSNLFIKQDFYGTDKFHLSYIPTSRPAGTLAAHIQGQCIPQPCTDDMISQIWAAQFTNLQATPTPRPTGNPPASQPTGAELISAVTAAQRLAHSLREACTTPHVSHSPHSRCSSCTSVPDASERKRIRDREQHDALILSLERKNAEDIAALKLDRDIEQKFARAFRDKEVQALLNAAQSGDLNGDAAWRCDRPYTRNALTRAELELEQRESRLLLREMEQERKLLACDIGNHSSSNSSSSSREAISRSDPQLQFNLFQDLSTARGDSNGSGNGRGEEARTYYMDGLRDGLEREREWRRGSVDRGARRRLVDTVARVEAEVECLRRRGGRGRERRRDLDGDRWDRWERWEGDDDFLMV